MTTETLNPNDLMQISVAGMKPEVCEETGNIVFRMERSNNVETVDSIIAAKEAEAARPIVSSAKGIDIARSLDNVQKLAATWYQNSTKELYAVLGQCYELYYLIQSAEAKQRDKYKEQLKSAYLRLMGTQGARQVPTRIVSIVFNFADMDRQTRSRYGSVLKAAYDASEKPTSAEAFVAWLESKGGIVAALAKREGSGTGTSQAEINEYVRRLPSLGELKLPNDGNKMMVLLASAVDKDTVEVVYVSHSDALADTLAGRAYRNNNGDETKLRSSVNDAVDALIAEHDQKEAA